MKNRENVLETKRLLLRPPKISDWKDIVEGVKDLGVSKYLAVVPHPYTKKDALWFINDSLKKWRKKEKNNYRFFIELKSEKKVIGVTDIHGINYQDKVAKTGSWIARKYWRKGYILEAKIAVMDFIFNKLKMRKIETEAFVVNKASNHMQKRLGFRCEGTKIKTTIAKSTGKIHDAHMYGLLKEEWVKVKPKLVKIVKNKQK